jgi:hypothetical protein
MKPKISNACPATAAIKYAFVACAALSLSAGVSVWYGHKDGVVALIITPRQYVPVAPCSTTAFTAVAWWGDGTSTTLPATNVSWQCSPLVGSMTSNILAATSTQPAYGWVEGGYSGLTTRVYVKVTTDGFWNQDTDADGDGLSDATELLSNSPPDKVGFINVRCRIR